MYAFCTALTALGDTAGNGPAYVELGPVHVLFATALIVVNGAVSVALRLGLARSLAVAAVRTVVQLLLIGVVLQWVFRLDHAAAVLPLMLLMTLVAGITAAQRTSHRYPGIWSVSLISTTAASWLITLYALLAVVRGEHPWYQPQYAIPLMGMVLGNTLNGISLGLGTLMQTLADRRDRVEVQLALGATNWEAAGDAVRRAVRTGMMPMINSMMVVGLVSLPGMMTGQLLAGAAPIDAVKYQIVIMFLIASATAMGTVSAVLLSYRRLFNARHQFLYQRLRPVGHVS